MRYCNRMKRSCSCGRLVVYNETGNVQEVDGGTACLTDSEIRSALGVLLREWRKRCMEAEFSASRLGYH